MSSGSTDFPLDLVKRLYFGDSTADADLFGAADANPVLEDSAGSVVAAITDQIGLDSGIATAHGGISRSGVLTRRAHARLVRNRYLSRLSILKEQTKGRGMLHATMTRRILLSPFPGGQKG